MVYLNRFEALLKEQGVKYIRFDDTLLREYNRIIIPLGPIFVDKPKTKINTKLVFKKLKGKLLWWSYYDSQNSHSEWYAVIKDRHQEIEQYPSSNVRNQIRKGLKNCDIRRVSLDELLERGYPVYKAALRNHSPKTIQSLDTFQASMHHYKGFEDIVHFWGVFHNTELIGYSVLYIYDKLEANISEIRIDPAYNKLYSSYALFHELSKEYLGHKNFEYLSDGYRNLMHQTHIQDMLIKKFGFKKVGLQLHLAIRFPYNCILLGLYPFKSMLKFNSLSAVFKLMHIYREQKKLPK